MSVLQLLLIALMLSCLGILIYWQYCKKHNNKKTTKKLYYFYHPECPHCKSFMPIWTNFVNQSTHKSSTEFIAIDASDDINDNLVFYYNIQGYPTILMVTDKKHTKYDGNRTVEDLNDFINKN